MILNVFITVFYFLSDYIFHGAALVALPCSCRWAALFRRILLVILLVVLAHVQ